MSKKINIQLTKPQAKAVIELLQTAQSGENTNYLYIKNFYYIIESAVESIAHSLKS